MVTSGSIFKRPWREVSATTLLVDRYSGPEEHAARLCEPRQPCRRSRVSGPYVRTCRVNGLPRVAAFPRAGNDAATVHVRDASGGSGATGASS